MKSIIDIAKRLGVKEEDLYLYGSDKAKIMGNYSNNEKSKLILVTAINPTPYGEGKTTVSIGLNDALCRLGKKSVAVLREPSLGPVFGMKGGATGGGKATVVPSDDIDLHFTGDFHAITSANNLMCAALYNHLYQGNSLNIDEKTISIKRCLDVNDRELRENFNITAASELMAIFCLANDKNDLRNRLGNILVAYNKNREPIFSRDLKVDGAMFKLLEHAFKPNLVQTLEENPVLIHGGPFANIAHGCNSIVATKLGLNLADYVITEAGFGSDLGAEKFIDIKCRKSGLKPNMIVLVVTVRALKHSGIDNLQAHIDNLNNYNVPFCVSLNQFIDDKNEDIEMIKKVCLSNDIPFIIANPFNEGGEGCLELAATVVNQLEKSISEGRFLYEDEMKPVEKMERLAKNVYHAKDVVYSSQAKKKLEEIEKLGINDYCICVAKTPYSISDDSKKLGYPKDHIMTVRDITIQTGSQMLVFLLNNIITMPGLPKEPNFEKMN